MNIKLIASFLIILLSFSAFTPISILAQEIKASDRLQIEFSSKSLTKKEKIEQAIKQNEGEKELPNELTIEKLRIMKLMNIESFLTTLDADIQKLDNASFKPAISSPKSFLHEAIEKKRKELKPFILQGYDYAVYQSLSELRSTVRNSFVPLPPTGDLPDTSKKPIKKINSGFDNVIESIKAQTLPVSFKSLITIYESPLKQFKQGIPIDQIICKENLVLFKNNISGKPGCFKVTSVQKVIERGWGTKVN